MNGLWSAQQQVHRVRDKGLRTYMTGWRFNSLGAIDARNGGSTFRMCGRLQAATFVNGCVCGCCLSTSFGP